MILGVKFRFWMMSLLLFFSKGYAKQICQTQLLGEGVVRFYDANTTIKDLPPSMSFEREPNIIGQAPASWTLVPKFGIDKNGRHTATIKIKSGTSLYGTGEVSGNLLRNGYVIECWNTDAYGYSGSTKSLYQSHPWVLAVRKDGTAFGVLADTTWRCQIDLSKDIKFSAEGPSFPVIVIDADSPQNVLKKLATLIGKMPLPPKWAIGYHQCRYSYYPDKQVLKIAKEFRSRNIPCDVIWMDIDYMNGFRIFTFNRNRFPDPAGLNNDLHKMGFKSVWMIDPGVKAKKGYFVYDQGIAGDFFVKKANGREYNGRVWPGMCAFPDFTMPQTQNWWASLYKPFMAKGIDGVWNDMDEPAVFKTPSKTMPEDNIHRGGNGLPKGPHAQYHNVYGMLMVKASRQGIQQANPDKRPFILTRANFIGGHRYAATWTGDNTSDSNHLEDSVSMILNLGLSGQPFCGPDIGGFRNDCDGKMFARWMGVGALLPFARGHTEKGNMNKEPWMFGGAIEASCRTSLERRYRLLPYLYTLFYEASTTGLPVARPVFFADPADPKLRQEDNAFLLGSDLLVVPKLRPELNLIPNLPAGIWRSVSLVDEDITKDANQPELKIRGGAIIPLGRVVQNTEQQSLDPLTLLICLDENGQAKGTLYEDAGDGYGYLSGQYLLTNYIARLDGDNVIVEVAGQQGKMQPPKRDIAVKLITEKNVKN
ncbi:MAG: TIM-barrel domain-containing protein [Phycisphaerae bacterium]|jgi:alpha-glucosidase